MNCPCGQLWHEACRTNGPWKGATQRRIAVGMILRSLEEHEEFWRREVGDDDYENSLEYWRGRRG